MRLPFFLKTALMAGLAIAVVVLSPLNIQVSWGETPANSTPPSDIASVSSPTPQDPGNLAQVTSVSQFPDVQPTDFYFQSLQSLVERYGCILPRQDGTFGGQQMMTRGEFVVDLNDCLDSIANFLM
ncbi:S-layer homology domain-containing protein [Geitlerinema sp. P-1104]|nr:S-layer homology domain-containing protein [Geitlerinema sp. P-1104]